MWGWIGRESGIKNSFFKYYNIKFLESQMVRERTRVRFLICELKGEQGCYMMEGLDVGFQDLGGCWDNSKHLWKVAI